MITAEMEEMKMSSVFDTTGSRVTFGFTESGFVEPDSVEAIVLVVVARLVLVVVARLVLVVVARLVLVVVLVLVVADGTQYS